MMLGVNRPSMPGTPPATPAAQQPMIQISPQVTDALQKIAGNLQNVGGAGAFDPTQIDKNSPEYRQAMLMQLAQTGPMGAAGSVMMQMADAQKQRQQQQMADQAAWMPTIKYGE